MKTKKIDYVNQINLLLIEEFNLTIQTNTKIENEHIDIFIPDKKVAILICDLYNYSSEFTGKKGNLEISNKLKLKDIRLIMIYEDECLKTFNIVYTRIKHILGLSPKGVGARKLTISEIDWPQAKLFLNKYHIQGSGIAPNAKYGAFYENNLVGVMTFARPNPAKGGKTTSFDELSRFATDGNNYPGMASRLFKTYVKEKNPPGIISYADKRWSEGKLYLQLGFVIEHETYPNYFYCDQIEISRKYRWGFQKKKISHLVDDPEWKTEHDIMDELGYIRIYDCGNYKFVWTPK